MKNYLIRDDIARCALLLALLVFLALFLAPRTHAIIRMTPAIALWRITAHEASLPRWDENVEGWVSRDGRPFGDDAMLIHEVLLRGAARTGMDYVSFARAYANRMFRPLSDIERTRLALGLPLDDGNRWAGFLDPSLERAPSAWPSGSSWTVRQAGARFVLELATEVVENDLEALNDFSPCEEPVDDWGSPVLDHDRAQRLGLVHVDCGDSVNWGYARPSQIRAREISGEWARVDPE